MTEDTHWSFFITVGIACFIVNSDILYTHLLNGMVNLLLELLVSVEGGDGNR